MKIEEDVNLTKYNTFRINVKTKYYIKCINDIDIINAINFGIKNNLIILPLGYGSNILFTKNFKGLIIHILTQGINIIKENENEIYIQVKSGEKWNNFVKFCIKNKFWGIENLSFIPGSVGASPIQNIGAYGVEVQEMIESLRALKIKYNKHLNYFFFTKKDCQFSYRDSYFKKKEGKKWIITDITFKLLKNMNNQRISYKSMEDALNKKNINNPTIENIYNIIKQIRKSKLPDYKKIGNAGSFFKNPIINNKKYKILKNQYYDLEGIKMNEGFKISGAYLIEKLGFKGIKINNYGIHSYQSLVLVNYSDANGLDILKFSKKIKNKILNEFGIKLEEEVNIV